jgi:hypothetical protein
MLYGLYGAVDPGQGGIFRTPESWLTFAKPARPTGRLCATCSAPFGWRLTRDFVRHLTDIHRSIASQTESRAASVLPAACLSRLPSVGCCPAADNFRWGGVRGADGVNIQP